MTSSLRTIGPKRAQEILDQYNNDNYRPLNPKAVEDYARDMRNGKWREELEDPIRFDVYGELQDGQTRLAAVVQSGVDIKFRVVTDIPRDSRDHIDQGRKRQLGQVLQNRGYTNGNVVAASKRLELDVISVRQGRGMLGNRATYAEIVEMCESDPNIKWIISNVINNNAVPKKFLNTTTTTYAYGELHKIDPYAAAEFFAKLVTPENMTREHPIMAAHNRFMLGNWTTTGRLRRMQEITVLFRTWNSWRMGEDRKGVGPVSNDLYKLNVPVPTKESVLTRDPLVEAIA